MGGGKSSGSARCSRQVANVCRRAWASGARGLRFSPLASTRLYASDAGTHGISVQKRDSGVRAPPCRASRLVKASESSASIACESSSLRSSIVTSTSRRRPPLRRESACSSCSSMSRMLTRRDFTSAKELGRGAAGLNPNLRLSQAGLVRRVPCRIGGADPYRASLRRASAAPRSAAPFRRHPRRRSHPAVGPRPLHPQLEERYPQSASVRRGPDPLHHDFRFEKVGLVSDLHQ